VEASSKVWLLLLCQEIALIILAFFVRATLA
jgi:hypothetical protein